MAHLYRPKLYTNISKFQTIKLYRQLLFGAHGEGTHKIVIPILSSTT